MALVSNSTHHHRDASTFAGIGPREPSHWPTIYEEMLTTAGPSPIRVAAHSGQRTRDGAERYCHFLAKSVTIKMERAVIVALRPVRFSSRK